jgi:hypothetical protein
MAVRVIQKLRTVQLSRHLGFPKPHIGSVVFGAINNKINREMFIPFVVVSL